jgi:hypothetical protein
MEALASPFPSDERTPPVVKMYFIANASGKISWKKLWSTRQIISEPSPVQVI